MERRYLILYEMKLERIWFGMFYADQSAEDSPEKKCCHQEIAMDIEESVEHRAAKSFLPWTTWILMVVSMIWFYRLYV